MTEIGGAHPAKRNNVNSQKPGQFDFRQARDLFAPQTDSTNKTPSHCRGSLSELDGYYLLAARERAAFCF